MRRLHYAQSLATESTIEVRKRFGIEGRQNNMIEKYVQSPSALYKLLDLNREVDTDKSRIQSSLTYNEQAKTAESIPKTGFQSNSLDSFKQRKCIKVKLPKSEYPLVN